MKHSKKLAPKKNFKLSIVTVVFNMTYELQKTIESVISQSYNDMEFIVIDGGSSKDTINIINKYKHYIDIFVSEPDDGIYDAMNKGIGLANGEWINFMNAGDVYFNQNTLKEIFENSSYANFNFIVGDTLINYPKFQKIKKVGNISEWWKGSQFIHQSTFIRSDYHKNNLYNVSAKIGADYEFFYHAIENNESFYIYKKNISIFDAGGVSDKKRILALFSNLKFLMRRKFSFKFVIFYLYRIIIEFIKAKVKSILPNSIVSRIQKI